MISKRNIPLFLAVATLFSSISSFAKDPNSFSLYLTTNAENRYGGNIMINVGSMPMSEIPETLLPASDEPVEVVVVVPKGAPAESREEFIGQIRTAMNSKYLHARYNIRESFVDVDAEIATYQEQQAELEKMKPGIIPGTDADKLEQRAEKEIAAGIEEDKQFKRSWFNRAVGSLNSTHPYNTVIAAKVVALTKLATSSIVLLSRYGINPVSLVIAGISGGVAAMFGYNAKAWSEWSTSHEFPWLKDNLFVRTYNRLGWFKSATINLIRSAFTAYVLRELAYLSHQTVNGKPVDSPNTGMYAWETLGLSVPEVVLDGLLDDGARSLETKGVLNHQSRSYILWTIGLIDTTMHAFFRAGAVNTAYTVAVVSWASKLAVWGTSMVLKANPKRFVFISNDIGEEKTAKLTESKNVFGYLAGLVKNLAQSISNSRAGKFSESDEDMVKQDLGLGETWNLALPSEKLERIQRDPTLTQKEFVKMLNLKDTDRSIVNSLWNLRNQKLNHDFNPVQACAEALAS